MRKHAKKIPTPQELDRMFWRQDRRRLDGLVYENPVLPRESSKVVFLKVRTDFFKAVATWRKCYGLWSCIQTDTSLKWMLGMQPHQAKIALLKMGAEFRFE